jgi:hypothetical protein
MQNVHINFSTGKTPVTIFNPGYDEQDYDKKCKSLPLTKRYLGGGGGGIFVKAA